MTVYMNMKNVETAEAVATAFNLPKEYGIVMVEAMVCLGDKKVDWACVKNTFNNNGIKFTHTVANAFNQSLRRIVAVQNDEYFFSMTGAK